MSIGRSMLWYYQSWGHNMKCIFVLLIITMVSSHVMAQSYFDDSGGHSMDSFDAMSSEDEGKQKMEARGVIQARNQAVLASSISAQITDMPVLAGMSFKKGTRLVTFDCRKPMADVRASNANVAIQKQKVAANKEMASFESISDYEVLVSEAELNKAIAEKESLDSYVSGCEIRAPYSGKVVEKLVNRYEVVATNEPLLSIIDVSHLEVSIIVPSNWLRWLKVNTVFLFSVDEVGKQLHGKVNRILPVIDPVSRTVKVIGEFSSKEVQTTGILPGMSGSADFND